MNLYSPIFTRKSTRKFDMTPLDSETIQQIETFISRVTPLLPKAEFTHKIVGPEGVKGLAIPKSPHFMLISGKEQLLRNTCAGFLFQHVELYLYSMGFATRWLGSVKGKQNDPNHIVGFAFGKPAEPAIRKLAEFERKSIAEIATGTDSRLEAVRLAPSGLNKQPWYFIVDGDAVHVYYQESLGGLIGMMYKLTDVDIGIALCHMAVASEHEGKPFRFSTDRKEIPIPPKNFTYIGTVE
jgi:nitroreductase